MHVSGPVVPHVAPPGEAKTAYAVTALPPFEAGGVHDTCADPPSAIAVTPVGAPGGIAGAGVGLGVGEGLAVGAGLGVGAGVGVGVGGAVGVGLGVGAGVGVAVGDGVGSAGVKRATRHGPTGKTLFAAAATRRPPSGCRAIAAG